MPGPAAKAASVVILDMAAVIHIIKPQRASVFGEYPYAIAAIFGDSDLLSRSAQSRRVWDTYKEASLKSQTLQDGVRLQLAEHESSAKIPLQGRRVAKFLEGLPNNDELFQFISQNSKAPTEVSVYLLQQRLTWGSE
ncbi:hypothetical protein GWK47_049216 [Chionoecetes opilio]|uniref:Uncharacterized protein n=1 Tax=Chionoecetes opilio TaxID=41210 RepID=A0A8J4Y3P4_CHIOP|nr:hypothetical protein GWK47_049216 [Chionoecetes opilio]